jgi:hypothetical protein
MPSVTVNLCAGVNTLHLFYFSAEPWWAVVYIMSLHIFLSISGDFVLWCSPKCVMWVYVSVTFRLNWPSNTSQSLSVRSRETFTILVPRRFTYIASVQCSVYESLGGLYFAFQLGAFLVPGLGFVLIGVVLVTAAPHFGAKLGRSTRLHASPYHRSSVAILCSSTPGCAV